MGFSRQNISRLLRPQADAINPLPGYALVSLGILLATTGGSWDISNHLLNKPETFFAPPHAVLYSGVAIAVVGAVLTIKSKDKQNKKSWRQRFVVIGIGLLVIAGPIDFSWHSKFGLDGLLSPPHFVLVLGMVLSSLGSFSAISRLSKSTYAVALSSLPLWLALSGMIYLFSLPFSKTNYFDFNPDPNFAAGLASIGFPLIISLILGTTSILAGRKIGAISISGGSFVLIGLLSSILPNTALVGTVPFYLLNLLPIFVADICCSVSKNNYSYLAAGAIMGLMFITLYYPLVTHTYNKVLMPQRLVWPSMTGIIYFSMLPQLFTLLAVPSIAAGICGSVIALKFSKVL